MEKVAKAAKEQLRAPLFELMTEVVMEEIPLSRKKVVVSNDELADLYGFEFEDWKAHNYPTWSIVGISAADDDNTIIEIEENPYYMKYEFEVGGFKYGRTTQTPTPTFDAEGLVKDHPELAELVEEETKIVYTLNDLKASRYMAEHPESKKVFEKYVKVGVPTVKMIPIREVTEG